MSTIAWDGRTLAADKQAVTGGMREIVTKARLLPNGQVLAWTGEHECGLILAAWYESGADIDKWPKFQSGDDWTRLIVASANEVIVFERQPVGQLLEEPFMAWGSGRDYAMGAMAMGASAGQAVEVASRFDINTGLGVDLFCIHD